MGPQKRTRPARRPDQLGQGGRQVEARQARDLERQEQYVRSRATGHKTLRIAKPVNAAPRPRYHHDGFSRSADQCVQRRVIAARQPQPRAARQPPPRPQRTSLRDPSPRTVASRDHARAPKLTVRARHRAGRIPQLRRQRPGRRQRRTRRSPPIRDLQGQRPRQILHHLQRYRYHDRRFEASRGTRLLGHSVAARQAANQTQPRSRIDTQRAERHCRAPKPDSNASDLFPPRVRRSVRRYPFRRNATARDIRTIMLASLTWVTRCGLLRLMG